MKTNTTTVIASRETYLAFVADWKESYKLLSAALRQLKRAQADIARFAAKSDSEELSTAKAASQASYAVLSGVHKRLPDLGPLPDHCRDNVSVRLPLFYHDVKDVANYMLAVRKELKIRANEAWKRQHTEEMVAAA